MKCSRRTTDLAGAAQDARMRPDDQNPVCPLAPRRAPAAGPSAVISRVYSATLIPLGFDT
jgi:hypothetical protein